MSRLQIVLGEGGSARRLSSLTAYGEVEVVNRWPGGFWEFNWEVPVRRHRRITQFEPGTLVRGFYGGHCVGTGLLDEPDRGSGEMVASGLVRRAEQALALGPNGQLTTNPDEAVDGAVSAGLLPHWVRAQNLVGAAFGDPNQIRNMNKVADVLDEIAKETGMDWGVSAEGLVYQLPMPTTPTVVLTPDVGELGISEERLVGSMVGRYIAQGMNSGTVYANTERGSEGPEEAVDLTDRGVLASNQAQAIVDGFVAAAKEKRGWTNSIVVGPGQIRSLGSASMSLAQLAADGRQMMRLRGLRDEQGSTASVEVQIGESSWKPADKQVTLSPRGLVPRDLPSLVEAQGGKLL